LLVLAAHAVTLALCRFKWDMIRRWALAAAGGAALVSPLALVSLLQHASVSWIGPPTVIELRVQLQDYFGVTPLAAAIVGACVIIAVLPPWGDTQPAAPGVSAPGVAAEPRLSLPSVAVPLLIVPVALLMGESFIGPPLYVDRYVLFGECGAALLAGAGVVRLGRWLRTATGQRWLIWAPGIVVCVAVFAAQLAPQQSIRMPRSRLFDFNAPARYIGANARPGDGVLFFDTFFRKDRLLYPRDFANTDDFGQAHSPVQEGTFRGTDKAFRKVRPLILDHSRIWVVGMAPSDHLATWLLTQQSRELMRYFVLVSTRHFRGIDVTLWRRTTRAQPVAPP
jgi:mannosyltransferase